MNFPVFPGWDTIHMIRTVVLATSKRTHGDFFLPCTAVVPPAVFAVASAFNPLLLRGENADVRGTTGSLREGKRFCVPVPWFPCYLTPLYEISEVRTLFFFSLRYRELWKFRNFRKFRIRKLFHDCDPYWQLYSVVLLYSRWRLYLVFIFH